MDESFNQGMNELRQPAPPPPKESHRKKWLIGVLVLILLAAISAIVYMIFFHPSASAPSSDKVEQSIKQVDEKKRVRLIATGDMIPHDAINAEAKQADGSYDYYPMFGDMKQLFDNADVRFCNQATLAGGTEYGVSGYPVFNAPTQFSKDMAKLGCNVINTGSNHVNDLSQDVISASVEVWDGLPNILAVAGANTSSADMQKVHYFEVKGVKFAFVSYTTYTNKPSPNGFSVTMYSDGLAEKQLSEARSKADVVIASLRWGTEYSPEVNAAQSNLAPKLANYGADVILGHGPHVLEPTDEIMLDDGRKAYVWYSLGNFLNAQLPPETLFNGIAVMDIDPSSKKIENMKYLPVYMHYEWTAADKAAGKTDNRKNFSMYTFDEAEESLKKSQNDTTLQAQQERISQTLNKLTKVKLLTKDEYFQS